MTVSKSSTGRTRRSIHYSMPKTGMCVLIALSVLGMASGCCDKGNNPQEVRYRLIAGPSVLASDGLSTNIYFLDVGKDSLVDSIGCPGVSGYFATPGAPYVVTWCSVDHCYRIANATTLAEITTNCQLNDVYFDIEHDLIVGFRAIYQGGPYLAEAVTADLHSGQVLSIDTIVTQAEIDSAGISHLVTELIHPATGMVYGIVGYEGVSLTEVFAFDYLTGRLHKIWQIDPGDAEGRVPVNSTMFTIHPDGRRLYFVPLSWADLLCFDLRTEEILFRVPAPAGFQRFTRVNPSGTEVYVLAQGTAWSPPSYSKVAVYDAASGALLSEIPLDSTVLPDNELPLYPCDISFVPGVDKAYLASGLPSAGHKGEGKIVVLDTDKRAIVEILRPRFSFAGWPGQITVVPSH